MAPSRASSVREGGGEASVGVVQARLWSRETGEDQGADALWISGRQHHRPRRRERSADPARSKNPACTKLSMRENREIRSVPRAEVKVMGREGKAEVAIPR